MISIPGKVYDGKRSDSIDAILCIYDSGEIDVKDAQDHHIIISSNMELARISPRLADTPRYIHFPKGEQFETVKNDPIDQALKDLHRSSWMNIVHLLESRKKYLLLAMLILALFVGGSIKYGIPAASKLIAFQLPASILNVVSKQSLQILDRSLLRESQLQEERKEQILRHFQPVMDAHKDLEIKVFFRKGGSLGPNAFALPDGVIIFTDEIIRIAEHDDELVAVLVHEIGHVLHRHSMRSLVQDSLLGFTLLAITGDVAGSSELFLGFPVLLTEMAYSRGFEWEADTYTLEWLISRSIDPEHFSRLMLRIEQKKNSLSKESEKKWSSYLSTHPLTKERIERFVREKKPPS